jgi:hypothetical protein
MVIASSALPELRLLPFLLAYVILAGLLGALYSKLTGRARHPPGVRSARAAPRSVPPGAAGAHPVR